MKSSSEKRNLLEEPNKKRYLLLYLALKYQNDSKKILQAFTQMVIDESKIPELHVIEDLRRSNYNFVTIFEDGYPQDILNSKKDLNKYDELPPFVIFKASYILS